MEAGLLTIAVTLLLVPFQMWAESQQKWRMLDPVEQNLRRASQGFTVVVFVLLAAFEILSGGPSGMNQFLTVLMPHPSSPWPAALALCALFVYGMLRFVVGLRRLGGTRDALRLAVALVKLALALGALVYLWRTWPWFQFTNQWYGYTGLLLVSLAALWIAVSSGTRVAVLALPSTSSAEAVMTRRRKEKNAPLRPVRRW